MNLLEETREIIAREGRTAEDVVFIGSRDSGHSCTWSEFELIADREYDDDYGGAEVAIDLEVVFSDGATLLREEYDGSEWWCLHEPFVMPEKKLPMTSVFVDRSLGDTLDEINAPRRAEGRQ